MKKSVLINIIKEEIQKQLHEYGSESLYYSSPGGSEQINSSQELRIQHYDNLEKWKVTAMQLGAVIQDRGEDFLAIMPNQDKLGTFSKSLQIGTLNLYS
jgi:hypothetical protein